MSPPYQCLLKCGSVLLAASLHNLDSFNVENGSRLSTWTCPTSLDEEEDKEALPMGRAEKRESGDSSKYPQANAGLNLEPPTKKRRLSGPTDTGETTAVKPSGHKTKQQNATSDKQGPPHITALTSTTSGKHVIAVTGEDKSIRVFEHDGRGKLRHISQRIMPKRPCAITMTADESTIICADKFGDVYSLPLLLPVPSDSPGVQDESITETASLSASRSSKPFTPAANDLTVHSVRNRKALQNQMRQKLATSEKTQPQFERKLLLGHVSMLTDIALLERNGQSYIITADRDEHIRISRGIPQAHVTEGYCLGHKEFVSRLCFPTTRPHLLVSGGGDEDIYIWNWLQKKVLQRLNLRSHVEKVMLDLGQGSHQNGEVQEENNSAPPEPFKIAVSNILHMRREPNRPDDIFIVTCEAVPAILTFSVLGFSTLLPYQNLRLEGNPLDVVVDSAAKSIIVSIDCAHQPGSTSQPRKNTNPAVKPLQIFRIDNTEWVKSPVQFNIEADRGATVGGNKLGRKLSDLLYPLENLRKIGAEE